MCLYRRLKSWFPFQENGTFIEVGGGDGESLSFTSQLEVLGNWKGLIIEPRKEAYQHMRSRRKAAGINACASGDDFHSKVRIKTLIFKPSANTCYWFIVFNHVTLFIMGYICHQLRNNCKKKKKHINNSCKSMHNATSHALHRFNVAGNNSICIFEIFYLFLLK